MAIVALHRDHELTRQQETSAIRIAFPIAAALVLSGCVAATSPTEADAPAPAASASPAAHYDTLPPAITEYMAEPAMLVFSKTEGWRHNEGIAGADRYFVDLARKNGWAVFTTANGAVFNPGQLGRFKLVVFNNMTGDALSPEQEAAFQVWLEAGGAWMGIHGSGDSSHSDWDWYKDDLIGPLFVSHPADPQIQQARVDVLAPAHPVMQGLPASFQHSEEWYTFDSRAQDHGMIVLAGVEEATYSPFNRVYGKEDLRMGEGAINHPVVWVTCPGSGRAFYSALGHEELAYDNPANRLLLENAFRWTTGQSDLEGAGCVSAP